MDTNIGRLNPAVLRLVAITDSLRDGTEGLAARASAAVRGGATMLQLRLKNESSRTLVEVARVLLAALPEVPLVVNERADVALAVGAHGVHLAVDDVSAAALRRVVPVRFVIGASVGGDADVARTAGADYVAIGPVFAAGSRTEDGVAIGPERFAMLAARCGLPAVAIGGITPANAPTVLAAGANGIALISAIFGAADPMTGARALRDVLDANGM